MTNVVVSFFAGAFGGVFTWLILEFVQKPTRGFFDLKKESIQVLTRYANVQARANQVSLETERQILDLSHEQESRLREAEAALRDCGTKFIAFARTETTALVPLRWLGYAPADVGNNFIGLSNSIGEYGSHRNHYQNKVETSLKLKA